MKKCNIILTDKVKKYQHYHPDKNEYLTSEELLPSDQSRMIVYLFFFMNSF